MPTQVVNLFSFLSGLYEAEMLWRVSYTIHSLQLTPEPNSLYWMVKRSFIFFMFLVLQLCGGSLLARL